MFAQGTRSQEIDTTPCDLDGTPADQVGRQGKLLAFLGWLPRLSIDDLKLVRYLADDEFTRRGGDL